jgi:glyoxylase-like metal-dependent hydrolase (beta-lactamase superfamily II)
MTTTHAQEGGGSDMQDLSRSAAVRIIAGNGDSWTLGGTNTWLIADTDSGACIVLDPGPHLPPHVEAVVREVSERRLTVEAIVLTHCHEDHADAAPVLSDLWEVPVRAVAPHLCRAGTPVADEEQIAVGDRLLTVLHTPGHTEDSATLHDAELGVLYTGDTVLGGAPTVIDVPGGSLRDYLTSMERLLDLAASGAVHLLAPGHGRAQENPHDYLRQYREHRLRRLDEVRQLTRTGIDDARAICARLYPDVDPVLASGAMGNVQAALRFLQDEVVVEAATEPAQPEEIP